MKLKVGIFMLMAMVPVAFGVYAAEVETPLVPAEAVQQEAAVPAAEAAVLPWEDPFLQLMGDGQQLPYEPQIIPKVWCCKPDGNCAKIKQTKCVNIGGVQHRTENACYADVNC